jgi:hypothetical protein
MGIELQPRFVASFTLAKAGSVHAGAYLSLPRTSIDITQLATTDFTSNCENSTGISIDETIFGKQYPKLTHIVPKAEIGLELGVGLEADVVIQTATGTTITPLHTAFALSTTCLAFQTTAVAGGNAYVPASAVVSSVKAVEKKGAGRRLVPPLGALLNGTRIRPSDFFLLGLLMSEIFLFL